MRPKPIVRVGGSFALLLVRCALDSAIAPARRVDVSRFRRFVWSPSESVVIFFPGVMDQATTTRPDPSSDPPTVVVIFGLLTAAGLWCVGMLGLTTAALGIGATVVVSDVGLMFLRRRSLATARFDRVAPANNSGATVTLTIGVLSVVAALPYVLIRSSGLPLEIDEVGQLWPLRGIALGAVAIAGVVHLSALVDWAYIRPRLLGGLGDRALPCQRHESTSWRLLTKLWLGHRLGAYLIVRLGSAAIIGFAAASFQPRIGQPTGSIIGAIGAAVLVFFLNRLLPVFALVTNPPLNVGDRVVLAEEYGTGVTDRPVYYVVDVAIEGIKLLQLDEGGHPRGAAGRDPRREHDRSLSLTDVPRLLRFRGRFSGCGELCCRASHYCPHGFGEPVVLQVGIET